jgi:hypothetical protein
VDNINLDLGDIGWGGVDWICVAQNRDKWRALVSAVKNLRVSIKCWETIEWLHNLLPLE